MDSGTLLQRTRVNGFCDHSTVDQFQWVLEPYVIQTTRVNGFWNYGPVDQIQWGFGTIVQSTRVSGFWIYNTVDRSQGVQNYSAFNQSQWIREPYYRQPEYMGSGTILQ